MQPEAGCVGNDHLVIYGVTVAPALPILLIWFRLVRRRHGAHPTPELLAIVSLVTVSYAWIWVSCLWVSALGPYYSSRRYGTIQGIIVADILLALWVPIRGLEPKLLLLLSCFLSVCAWVVVWAVNAAV